METKKKTKLLVGALAPVVALGAVACSSSTTASSSGTTAAAAGTSTTMAAKPGTTMADKKDIVATAVGAGSFKTLAAALDAAGLVDTLKGAGPFTVFAPTDDAFAKLPAGTVETLLKPENKAKLATILTYHVVKGNVPASEVVKMDGKTVETVAGQTLTIKVAGGKVSLTDATGATVAVVKTDVTASNGVIHVIDGVLMPKTDDMKSGDIKDGDKKDIVATATAAGSFKTLAAALQAAGLVETLQGPGPFTVFAPTDDAFAKLPAGTVETLLKPENKAKLATILTYHVVKGNVPASEVVKMDGKTVETVAGQTLTIKVAGGKVSLTDATGATVAVVKTDVTASNGVIHVIDGVLMPKS